MTPHEYQAWLVVHFWVWQYPFFSIALCSVGRAVWLIARDNGDSEV